MEDRSGDVLNEAGESLLGRLVGTGYAGWRRGVRPWLGEGREEVAELPFDEQSQLRLPQGAAELATLWQKEPTR